ncbi:hypothetical protein M0638_20540 [Roseomonas sp. NAR14]|uniref:Uncharacterized protein n=1 Tax=Roseomonas acroporae TaxID=2937791 RepID=A0A9X2BY99_9PROT|nr:hypothetical protein [Roseomonas acroporae]MCK8786764.1 hypothetical protein [Roseomonas acroporae]
MLDEQALKVLQAQLDENRDWLKFVLSEYFKWYAAFLALNLAALGFFTTNKPRSVAALFIAIDIVGAILAAQVLSWLKKAEQDADNQRTHLILGAQLNIDCMTSYPSRPIKFGLQAAAGTQLTFAAVWLWFFVKRLLPTFY